MKIREILTETPDTSGPIGTQPGGWRTYKPKPAGEIDEDTAYAGGNAGESYRKFKPKVAGQVEEDYGTKTYVLYVNGKPAIKAERSADLKDYIAHVKETNPEAKLDIKYI